MSKRRRHINNTEKNNFKILSIDRDRIMWNPIIKDVKKCHYKYQFPKLYITQIQIIISLKKCEKETIIS